MEKNQASNPDLAPYRVTLHEEPGDKFVIVFDCMAEDDDHAVEQAENAYPGCEIVNFLPFDDAPLFYVVYSPNESASNDGAGFWNNTSGWTNIEEASRYSALEKSVFNLPVSVGQDARWVPFNEAQRHYGLRGVAGDGNSSSNGVAAAFREEVGICINCMGQDDAMGETIVFVREDGRLVPKTIDAASIDMDNLQQYEMILFDGGNSSGDTWKQAFFPNQSQHYFVDENPLPRKPAAACNIDVSLDGGATWVPAPEGVRIVYKDVMVDGEDGRGEVHINATHEGLITDIWTTRDEPLDHNIGTDSVSIDDIVARLVSENG